MKPTCRARHFVSLPGDNVSSRSPATVISPRSGRSRPPIRFSSVVLPEPDGPISARNSPCATSRSIPRSTSTRCLPRRYAFATPFIETMLLMLALSPCFGAQERDACAHLGQHTGIAFREPDADLDGRLGAVGRRNDRDDAAGNAPVGI